MDVNEYYNAVYSACGAVKDAALAQPEIVRSQTAAINFLNDMKQWSDALKARHEHEVLDAAIREYQFALLALMLGQYRQSFAGLRLSLELSLATIYFSAYEFHFREWQSDGRDINWAALASNEDGVLSTNFIKAFFPELRDSVAHHRELAQRVYRECSEYVHGNASTHRNLPKEIEFSPDAFASWHQKADVIRLVVTYALSARYLEFLDDAARSSLSAAILDQLGFLAPIRAKFTV